MTEVASRVSGIPLYMVEAPGPRRALLAFRVGRADEPLAVGGVTHLVEHLALLPFRDQPYHYGGQVEGARTLFWVEGSDAQITEFFSRLCEHLDALPLDRLVDEARLLETEAASRKPSAVEALLTIRYGTRGWGAIGYPEYGLRRADPDRVGSWAGQWFTADNAAFGVTGAVPDGLSLPLRKGTRMAPPSPVPISLQTPAWMHERYPGIALGFVAPRTARFSGLMRVLERHGRERLRFTDSLSYQVSTGLLRLSADQMHGVVWADGLAENMSRVWTGLLAVVDELMARGPTDAELREDINGLRQAVEQPAWPLSVLDGQLTGDLLGTPPPRLEEFVAELESSTPADYAALLKEIFPNLLAAVPPSVAVLDPRFSAVPGWSAGAVKGRDYALRMPKSAAQKEMLRLTMGEDGVSLQASPGKVVTIRYQECSAALAWDDGSRTLLSFDSFRIHVRPADWTNGDGITGEIDRHLSPDVVVSRGPRPNPDPEALSGTNAAAQSGTKAAARGRPRRYGFAWKRSLIFGGLLILFYVSVAIVHALQH